MARCCGWASESRAEAFPMKPLAWHHSAPRCRHKSSGQGKKGHAGSRRAAGPLTSDLGGGLLTPGGPSAAAKRGWLARPPSAAGPQGRRNGRDRPQGHTPRRRVAALLSVRNEMFCLLSPFFKVCRVKD
ncbi:hypothetical protein E2C01_000881 [Portunus trituberculatus]|uniref:Uncharacterized protein n=1 Tax=Portunus trituberculatus TaxID=210409 RepID=A0A5B7CG86_PORTR|nr:hypothetical protein [Portunus trituberculatus]